MNTMQIMRFLKEAVIPDERERWVKTLDEPDISFAASMLAELGEWLGERYMNRPLVPRSVRRAGAKRTRTTSGAKSRASAGRTSGG